MTVLSGHYFKKWFMNKPINPRIWSLFKTLPTDFDPKSGVQSSFQSCVRNFYSRTCGQQQFDLHTHWMHSFFNLKAIIHIFIFVEELPFRVFSSPGCEGWEDIMFWSEAEKQMIWNTTPKEKGIYIYKDISANLSIIP